MRVRKRLSFVGKEAEDRAFPSFPPSHGFARVCKKKTQKGQGKAWDVYSSANPDGISSGRSTFCLRRCLDFCPLRLGNFDNPIRYRRERRLMNAMNAMNLIEELVAKKKHFLEKL